MINCSDRDNVRCSAELVVGSAGVGAQVLRPQSVHSESGGGEPITTLDAPVDALVVVVVRLATVNAQVVLIVGLENALVTPGDVRWGESLHGADQGDTVTKGLAHHCILLLINKIWLELNLK